jgi:hypothetical protein
VSGGNPYRQSSRPCDFAAKSCSVLPWCLRYKLDDLASNAAEAELRAVEFSAKQVSAQYQAAIALANTFVINSDQAVATSALARLKFVENSLHAISSADAKIDGGLKEASTLLGEYRQAVATLVENSKSIDELVAEMAESASAIVKGSGAMKADLFSDQQRLESESDATIGATERLIVVLAAGGFVLGGALALLLGRGISRPMIAMCKSMRELAGGKFDVVLHHRPDFEHRVGNRQRSRATELGYAGDRAQRLEHRARNP